MELIYYTNMAGQRFAWPERALEPPDCWSEGAAEPDEEDCDEEEESWQ